MSVDLWLSAGGHSPDSGGFCTMEKVAELAGEEHSDHPATAHSWLSGYCRRVTDTLGSQDRQLLGILLKPLVGSATKTLTRADAVRVQAAAHAVFGQPGAVTAAVFVSAVQLAIENAQDTGQGGIAGRPDPRVAARQVHAEAKARRLAAEAAAAVAEEERRAEARTAEEERTRQREATEQAKEEERQREIAHARSTQLSDGSVRAVQGLLTAMRPTITSAPAPRQLSEGFTVEIIPAKERLHAKHR